MEDVSMYELDIFPNSNCVKSKVSFYTLRHESIEDLLNILPYHGNPKYWIVYEVTGNKGTEVFSSVYN